MPAVIAIAITVAAATTAIVVIATAVSAIIAGNLLTKQALSAARSCRLSQLLLCCCYCFHGSYSFHLDYYLQ